MTTVLAALLAGSAVAIALAAPAPWRPARGSQSSGSAAVPPHLAPAHDRTGWLAHPLAWPVGSVLLGAAVWSWVGGRTGLTVGVTLGVAGVVGGVVVGRRSPRNHQAGRRYSSEDAALAADLLTAALDAGLPIGTALAATGTALGGTLGTTLQDAAAMQAVGADPTTATRALRTHPGGARLARAVARAQDSGMAPGAVLAAAAQSERDRHRSQQLSRAASAGAFAALPVGLLFLPAFVLVTVVPLVLGSISGVLG